MLPWNVTDSNHGKQSFAGSESNVNIGMHSMQVFFLAGWVEVGQCVHRKGHKFQKQKISKKGRKNLIYLNSHRYYVVYCLYCLNISTEKLNASVPRLLLSSSQPFGLVTQRPLFWKRARCVTRPNNYCEKRLRLMPFLQQRENQNYSSTVCYLKNKTPRYFTTKSKLKLCCNSNRPQWKIYCDLE